MLRLFYDYLGGGGLFLVAYLAWSSRTHGMRRSRQFSVVAAAGTTYLVFDETFSLHERLGTYLYDRGWREPAGINHFDDLVLLTIGLAGLAVAGFFASEILRDTLFAKLFALGIALFALGIVVDGTFDPTRTVSWWFEESLEFAGVLVMALGFWLRGSRLRGGAEAPM